MAHPRDPNHVTPEQAAIIKGLLARGDTNGQDIAHFFGISNGRVAEINLGKKFADVAPAPPEELPSIGTWRYIDPKRPAEEQYNTLLVMINNPPAGSLQVTMTPELAKLILKRLNTHNRTKRAKSIQRFAEYMGKDDWTLTGEPIKFSVTGILRDGQHRLEACVRSGVSFVTDIRFGVPEKAFDVIDTGTTRTNADTFYLMGVVNPKITASAVRWIEIVNRGGDRGLSFDNRTLSRMYGALPASDQDCLGQMVKAADSVCRNGVRLAAGQLAALLFLFHQHDAAKTAKFLGDLKSVKRRGSVSRLLRKVEQLRSYGAGIVNDRQLAGMVIIAWNEYTTNQPIAYLPDEPFPEIL